MAYLTQHEMLVQQTEQEYELTAMPEMTGSECARARHTREYRWRLGGSAAASLPSQCDTAVTNCDTEIEKESEKEKEKKER